MQKLECGASVKVFKYIYPGAGLVGHYKNYKRPFFMINIDIVKILLILLLLLLLLSEINTYPVYKHSFNGNNGYLLMN